MISNKSNAGGVEKAKQMGIPVEIVENTKVREEGEKTMTEVRRFKKLLKDKMFLKVLREFGAELICLAGFMRILTPFFVSQWRNRILNIHPSLLPSFKGIQSLSDFEKNHLKVLGQLKMPWNLVRKLLAVLCI